MEFIIEQARCTRCGICIQECPPKAIRQEDPHKEVRIHQETCIQCSHCGMVCPADAVLVDNGPLPPIPERTSLTEYEAADRLIRTKRSVRQYRSAPVLREDLEEILKTGSLTATASNSQQCEALVLQGGDVAAATSAMARQLLKMVRFLDNPLIRLLTKNTPNARYTQKDRVKGYAQSLEKTLEGRADPLFFRAPAVVILLYPKSGKRFGRTDCALAGAHMMLSAHARGLGSCMIGFAEMALKKRTVRRQLGIPESKRVGLVFTLGYTEREYYRYPLRKTWTGHT